MKRRQFKDEDIYDLANNGLTSREVTKALGGELSQQTVQKIISHGRRFGLCKPWVQPNKGKVRGKGRVYKSGGAR